MPFFEKLQGGSNWPPSRYRVNEPIMCGFYCIVFIEYMLAGKPLSDYINLFSPNYYQKNGKIIYMCFKDKYGKRKCRPWI